MQKPPVWRKQEAVAVSILDAIAMVIVEDQMAFAFEPNTNNEFFWENWVC